MHATAEAIYERSLIFDLYLGRTPLLCSSCERRFIIFRALITESQSHFEWSERVKRFTQDFLKCHRAVGAPSFAECEGQKNDSLRSAAVSDKLDLSAERKPDKEKYSFYCINKSVYVTPTVRENCAGTLLIFVLCETPVFLWFTRGVSEKQFMPCLEKWKLGIEWSCLTVL